MSNTSFVLHSTILKISLYFIYIHVYVYLHIETWFCCQILSRILTREKALQTPCMQLEGQQSRLRLVSLERDNLNKQHMTEVNKMKSVFEKMDQNWLYSESSSSKTKGRNMKHARKRLVKNKRKQFCLLQAFLEKIIVGGKSLTGWQGTCHRNLK